MENNSENLDSDARPLDLDRYMEILKVRKTKKKWQPTRHQQDAAETAELFDDVKSIGIYLNIFKKHSSSRAELLRCRTWVSEKGTGNKGRLFVAIYKKFLKP